MRRHLWARADRIPRDPGKKRAKVGQCLPNSTLPARPLPSRRTFPGLSAGLVRDGGLAHVTALGLADIEAKRPVGRETAFRIASMTKNMTALAVLSLRDAGKLALDAPLAEYVPQFAAVKPATRDSAPVTLRHLLSHMAGLVTDDPWGDRVLGMTPAELDAMIATGVLFARPPGLVFEYSNLGYGLVGRALTNVSGEPYQAYIKGTILEPLGMSRHDLRCRRRANRVTTPSVIAPTRPCGRASASSPTARWARWAASRPPRPTMPATLRFS